MASLANTNDGYKVIISTAVSFAIVVFAITGRFTARWLLRKRLEANDYLIIAALVPKLGIDIASILLVKYGIGQHIQHIMQTNPGNITRYLQVLYVGSFLYAPTIGFIKLSILTLYFVAFPFRWMARSTFVLGGIVVAWAVACCLVGLMACLPIHKAWNPTVPGTCINTSHYYYGLQIPNILTDVALLVLPLKAVFDLELGWAKSVQLCGALSIGIVTCIFDIVRLVVLVQLPNGGDFTYNQVAASMWTDLEPSVAMLAACLPIMRPLLHPKRYWRERQEQSRDEETTSEVEFKSSGDMYSRDGDSPYGRQLSSRSAGYT